MPKYRIEQDGRSQIVEANSPEEAMRIFSGDTGAGTPMYDKIGAPVSVRMKVGSARSAEDKLATLKKMYPDARRLGDDNFVYTDENGRTVKYNDDRWTVNPASVIGDIAEHARILPEMGGAAVGGALGIPGGLPGIMLGAGLGGAGASKLYDALSGAEDTRSTWEKIKSFGADAAFNSLTGPLPTARTPGQATISSIARAGDELGIPLTLAQRTQNPFFNSLESAVEGTIGGSGPVQRAREQTVDAAGEAINRISSNRYSTPLEAGTNVIDASKNYFSRMSDIQKRMYDAVESSFEALGNHTLSRIDIDNLKRLAEQRNNLKVASSEYGDLLIDTEFDKLINVLDNVTEGNLPPYEAIKQYRTSILSKMKNPFLTTDTSEGALKSIYGAASEDLNIAAEQLGGRQGAALRDRANRFFAKNRELAEQLEPILGKDPEKAFSTIENAFYNRPTTFSAILKPLNNDQRSELMSTLVHRMSMAKPGQQTAEGGQLSLQTFKTNWNKMMANAPENSRAFSPEQKTAIKHVLALAEDSQEFLRGVNFSRTGRIYDIKDLLVGGGQTGLGAAVIKGLGETDPIVTAIAGAIIGIGVPNLIGRIITNPTFAKTVTAASTKDVANVLSRIAAAKADEALIDQ